MIKMKRIIIITQGLSRIVEPLFKSTDCKIVGIIECAPRSTINQSNSRIIRLYHQIKKQRKSQLLYFSEQHSLPYFYMINSSDQLASWVKRLEPDLIIVYMMSQLLKENIYTIPKFGTINLHPSFLPKYRGPNPCFWTYYNMDKKGGVTVHFIDKGEDSGDIIFQEEYNIPQGIKSPDRLDIVISQIGIPLLIKAIKNIERIKPITQPRKSPTLRARNLKPNEHKMIIDWENWPIERIWHLLRGTELWLNAFPEPKGIYMGTRWIIDDFEKKEVKECLKIGDIYFKKKKHFIMCRDGIIHVHSKVNYKVLIRTIVERFLFK